MSKKWKRYALMTEWWREPLSPVAETWQTPLTESAVLGLFSNKLGIKAKKLVKVFNGYAYITSNYEKIIFPFGFIKGVVGFFSGIKTAKTEWEGKALAHSKQIDQLKNKNLKNLSSSELYDLCNDILRKEADYIAWSLYAGLYSFGFEYIFKKLLPLFVKQQGFEYTDLLKSFYNKSIEANVELWKSPNVTKWLAKYGHRIHDLDVIFPTLQDTPKTAVLLRKQLLQSHLNPQKQFEKTKNKRLQIEKLALKNVRWWIPFGKTLFLKLLGTSQSYVSIREDRPFYYKGQALARKILLEMGRRLAEKNKIKRATDIFFLTRDETKGVTKDKITFSKENISERKALRENQKKQQPPVNLKEPVTKQFPLKSVSKAEKEIKGLPASQGKSVGKVRIVTSTNDFDKFKSGEILVIDSTNPSFVPVITLAAGIVTNKGGALCHAAIISRELGIPAVVGTKTATSSFKNGDYLLVDGDTGLANVVDRNFALNFKNTKTKHFHKTDETIVVQNKQIQNRHELLVPINSVTKEDIALVGGKGASLGELTSLQLNVPQGFIVTTEMYGKKLVTYEKDILREFDKLKTKYVAVRSSATSEDSPSDSFAGQFDTFLNVKRNDLIGSIKKCWDSISNQRIIEYSKARNIDIKKIKMAVVIQEMIQPETAGICFTVDPTASKKNKTMIEAVYGLGEFIVSGRVNPDSYFVDRGSFKILDKRISNQGTEIKMVNEKNVETKVPKNIRSKQKLDDANIIELAKLSLKAEKHYNKPLDIEWAYQKNVLYFTQARPITTLN